MHTLERDRYDRPNVTMIPMKICNTVLIESDIRHQKTARLDYQPDRAKKIEPNKPPA